MYNKTYTFFINNEWLPLSVPTSFQSSSFLYISQKEILASLIGRRVFLRQQLFLVRIIVPKAIKNVVLKKMRGDVKRKNRVVS